MEYRLLRNSDIQSLVVLWNQSFEKRKIREAELLRTLFCDENYSDKGCILAIDKERLVGFCLGIKRIYPYWENGLQEDKGWVLSMAVAEDYRHQGIGTKLLDQVEKYLNSEIIVLANYSPHYFFPGVDIDSAEANEFFTKKGYQKKEVVYSMEKNLAEYEIPTIILRKKEEKEKMGYQFTRFTWKDGKELLDFLSLNFSVGWRKHIIEALRSDRAEEWIWLCKNKNVIVGYAQRGVQQEPGRFGPFGIAKAERNAGLGSILLHETWNKMKESGINRTWFRSTNERGKCFYERQGMVVSGVFYQYEKSFSSV